MDRFALVDEQGIVYTEHSTSSGLSRYAFLSEELTQPVINTLNLYGAKNLIADHVILNQDRQHPVSTFHRNIAQIFPASLITKRNLSGTNLLHEEDKENVINEYWDTVKDYTGEKKSVRPCRLQNHPLIAQKYTRPLYLRFSTPTKRS